MPSEHDKMMEKAGVLADQEARYAAKIARAAAEWKAKWPNHCPQCGGRGGATFYQSHGDGGPAEPMFDPCDCTLDGKCPRCMEPGLNEEGDGPCYFCGWNYDDACPEY